MDFEAYLISKKIDSAEFQKAEPELWKSWKIEFDQMHPASFTSQKLYLINPVRRKYVLKQPRELGAKVQVTAIEKGETQKNESTQSSEQEVAKTPPTPKPAVPRPVFKPKPKTS